MWDPLEVRGLPRSGRRRCWRRARARGADAADMLVAEGTDFSVTVRQGRSGDAEGGGQQGAGPARLRRTAHRVERACLRDCLLCVGQRLDGAAVHSSSSHRKSAARGGRVSLPTLSVVPGAHDVRQRDHGLRHRISTPDDEPVASANRHGALDGGTSHRRDGQARRPRARFRQ